MQISNILNCQKELIIQKYFMNTIVSLIKVVSKTEQMKKFRIILSLKKMESNKFIGILKILFFD